MKALIIGGHPSPALGVIEELSKNMEVIYVGRKFAMEGDSAVSFEYREVSKLKIPFENLSTGRLQRSFTRHTLPSLAKIPAGLFKSIIILKKFKPDVVVGFGGYVSVPIIIASNLLKIPIVIHEQTLDAGAANKFSARFAEKICISTSSSEKYFPKEKIVLTGNPIRKSILNPKKKTIFNLEKPTLYITGGSQGSHFINSLVMDCLPKLLEKYSIIHQTGDARKFSDFQKLSILKEGLNKDKKGKYFISKFFSDDEVAGVYSISSLVIGRAGINTVTELIALNKPGLLIPFAYTQKNEQEKNAAFLEEAGLAEVLSQKNLETEEFIKKTDLMMKNIDKYKASDIKNFYFKNAAKKIAQVVYETAQNHGN